MLVSLKALAIVPAVSWRAVGGRIKYGAHVGTVMQPCPMPCPQQSTSQQLVCMSSTPGKKRGETAEERAARKAAVKAEKQRKRAAREGRMEEVDPNHGRKPCDLCDKLCDLLIRCQIDESGRWYMVCGGKCWRDVSGGVVDGDAHHPHYRYGGLWKNLHKSAK